MLTKCLAVFVFKKAATHPSLAFSELYGAGGTYGFTDVSQTHMSTLLHIRLVVYSLNQIAPNRLKRVQAGKCAKQIAILCSTIVFEQWMAEKHIDSDYNQLLSYAWGLKLNYLFSVASANRCSIAATSALVAPA